MKHLMAATRLLIVPLFFAISMLLRTLVGGISATDIGNGTVGRQRFSDAMSVVLRISWQRRLVEWC